MEACGNVLSGTVASSPSLLKGVSSSRAVALKMKFQCQLFSTAAEKEGQ